MSKILITPLGTISPYTKGNMNCPGFLVKYHNKKILLDCGNGITRLLNFPEDLITEKKIFGKVSVDYVRSSQNIINYINKDAKQKEIFVNLFSKLLRNNYYIMMTRGRKGCFIYFTDRKGD